MNHRSANRSAAQRSSVQVSRSESATCSRIKPDSKRPREHSFFEDFNLEHSRSDVSIAVFARSAGADPAQPGQQRTADAREVRSPSCVYVG